MIGAADTELSESALRSRTEHVRVGARKRGLGRRVQKAACLAVGQALANYLTLLCAFTGNRG